MTVYFVYRGASAGLTGKHIKTLEFPSLLEWFQQHWKEFFANPEVSSEKLLGIKIEGLHDPREWEPEFWERFDPKSLNEVGELLDCCGVQGWLDASNHMLQFIPDSEPQCICYFFDDEYFAENPRPHFLLYSNLYLPDGDGPGGWKPESHFNELAHVRGDQPGQTYLVDLSQGEMYWVYGLEEHPTVYRLEGLRISDLARFLLQKELPSEKGPYQALRYFQQPLRNSLENDPEDELGFGPLIRKEPENEAHWQIYSDWLQEHGKRPVEYHLLERAVISARGSKPPGPRDLVFVGDHVIHVYATNQEGDQAVWVLFDDVWASAHSELANSLVKYASWWDIL